MIAEEFVESTPELKELRTKLRQKYPPHHWNHVGVFSRFWFLVEEMMKAEQ